MFIPEVPDRRWFTLLSEPFSKDEHPELTLYMPFAYGEIFARVIPKMKFKPEIRIAQFLGILLGSIMCEDKIRASLIVPVPLSKSRQKERGFNQAYEIAKQVGIRMQVPVSPDILVRLRDTYRQSEMKKNALRFSNVENAFEVNKEWDLEGNTVILIDDVATTGSTLHEAAVALLAGGCEKVLCCAVAGNRNVKNDEPY